MRMLVDLSFPLEPFNTLVRNGTAGQKIQQILEDLKPEAVYFSERGGKRGGILIVDVADPSKVPAIAEPFFLTFNASVEFHVVMGPDDLGRAGLDQLGKKYGN
ncbi:MAG TPA: panthothenate synthetase [Dehalococcoidia bacterium]|nr:panthothenate synthetase [Dehalococcoidia bacterium]